MSELNWNWAYFPWLDPPEKQKESAQSAGYIKVVSKSEADEVIAELKSDIADLRDDKKLTDAILDERNAEIAELKADYKEACDRLQTANLIKDEQLAATRHQKYKRCLDKARIAQDDWHLHNSFYAMGHQEFEKRKCEFYEKWRKRWLELAEKFRGGEILGGTMVQELKLEIEEVTEPQIFTPPKRMITWSYHKGKPCNVCERDVVAILPQLPNHANIVCLNGESLWWATHCGIIKE